MTVPLSATEGRSRGSMIVIRKLSLLLFVLAGLLLSQDDPAWKSKQIAAWTEEDARQVITSSPWALSFTPVRSAPESNGTRQGGMGRGGGMGGGMGGMNGGMGGMGGGMGRRGMGNGNYPGSTSSSASDRSMTEAPKLTLRWESAMPVRTAELKLHDSSPLSIDENFYAIAVYGIPDRMLIADPDKLADQFRKQAVIKRQGKKDFKPSSVRVLDRPDGHVVLYLFPMTNEIAKQDHRLEFKATIGRLGIDQSFFIENMVWDGKLAL